MLRDYSHYMECATKDRREATINVFLLSIIIINFFNLLKSFILKSDFNQSLTEP